MNFRNVCLQHCGLDPDRNCTSPGLSCQAALNMKDVQLVLLTDIVQHVFTEEGITGGVEMISHQYVRDNAPVMEASENA